MKKIYFLLLTVLCAALTTNAQLTGIKTIPGTYASIAAAVADLNAQGVGGGGVIFNIAAGYTETAPAGGINVTATGTAANTIVFQKSGAGANPLISAQVGTVSLTSTSATVDGIFSLSGSDYVTIDGIDLVDNNISGGPEMMEYGYALFKASATDGCQNNTIRNCVITLNKSNNGIGTTTTFQNGSRGIYLGNVTRADIVTDLVISTVSGRSSNNTFTGNTIQNSFQGIYLRGYGDGVSPYTFIDQNNSIGGNSVALGNTIQNFGTGTNVAFGISTFNQNNLLIQNNNVNNLAGGGATHGTTLVGISASGTFTLNNSTYDIRNNTVTLGQGTNTGQSQGISVGTAGGNGTVTISNNSITGFTNTSGATGGAVFGTVVSNTAGATVNITNNTYSNNQISNLTNMVSMQSTATAATVNITGNNFTNNTITNSPGGANFMIASSAAITGAFNINNNTVDGLTFTAANGQSVLFCQTTTAASTCALSISNNDIRNINFNVASTGAVTMITNTSATLSQNISNNTFTNLNLNTTGSMTFISNSVTLPANGVKNVNNNSIVTGFTKTGAGGTITLFTDNGSDPATATNNVNNNNFSNITVTGATTINGILNTNGGSPIKNVIGNTINNITGGTSTITALSINFDAGTTTVRSNTISNITGGGAITGILFGTSGTNGTTNASQNTVHSLSTTGTGTVTAIQVGGASVTNRNVFGNKIYNIQNSNAAGVVNGMLISSGGTINAYNNLIGDLKTPAVSAANSLNGINITSTTANSNINVSFNTVYLNATSSGANFGSSGIFHTTSATATTAALNLRNNIIVNNSTANGTGFTAAYRRSNTTLTNFNNASDRNLFYAGTPGATNLIFYDGTNADQTLAAYKARVTPREVNSVTENPPFLSTTGSSANFLHINPAGGSLAQGQAAPIAGISDDFDGDLRNGTTPDIGADEFTLCTGAVGGTASVTGSSTFCGSGTPVITGSGYSAGVGSGYQWMSSTNAANYPASGTPVAGQTNPASLNTGVVSVTTYYWLMVTCPQGTATAYSNMLTITVNPSAASITPSAPVICQGQSITLTENGGTGTSWSWSPGGATTQAISVSPATTTTYTVTVNSPGGCVANANVTVTVNPVPAGVTASASSNNICLGASVDLFSTATPPPSALLSQDFESGLGSWTTINNTTGGTPANTAWTLRPHGYVSTNSTPVTFNSPGGTQFILSNADLGGSGTTLNTLLQSPSFSTVGYSALNLSFRHFYRLFTSGEANVEVSTNGSTWTTVKSYTADQGTSTAFTTDNIDLSAYAGFPSVSIRYRYQDGWAWYWAIDDIAVTGTPSAFSFAWTSTPAGFTSTQQNPTGVSPTVTTTYTVTVTGIGGCTSSASTTVNVNTPNVSGAVVQPTTCVSTDGSITLTVTGGTGGVGPYSFAWTGPGVNPTSQNQTGLTVGTYNVTVTDVPSGCTSVSSFSLPGPGGCTICPTVGSLTTNPSPAVCQNANVTLTASGLLNMGVTYGITFKYSTVALADPYSGGTVIATVPNGALTSGGTVATTNTTFAVSGSYFIYAILSPVPPDVSCRPSASTNLDVNPIPTVNPVANQTVCAGATATANFSGSVPGTVYNWTNSNTAIGLAASGSGNISFTATNATGAPISGTITVTPSYTNGGATCTGTPTSFTFTINPTPTVNAVANQAVCAGAPTAAVNFSGSIPGAVYNWTNSNPAIGLAASGTGNIPSFTATNNTAGAISGTITVTPSYTVGGTTCTGTPTSFTITVNSNLQLVIQAVPGTTLCQGDPAALTVYETAGSSPVSITHSSSNTITAGNSVACNAGTTGQVNSYWRAYNLNNFPAVTGSYTITSATFGIEAMPGAVAALPITVNLYDQTGAAFPGGTRTLIRSQVFNIAPQTGTLYTATFTTPVTVPNTSTVIVEVSNQTVVTGVRFFIGSNAAAETDVSYLSSAACGITAPTPVAAIGFPNMHIILGLNGTVPGIGGIATGTFLWSPAAGLSSTTTNPVAASPAVTTTYTVVRTTPAGCVGTANITLTVNQRPVVTSQPASRTNCVGTTATFTVTGTGTGVTYQWQESTNGGVSYTNLNNVPPYSGVTTPTMTITGVTLAMNNNRYRCVLSGTCPPGVPPLNVSNGAILTVNALPVVTVSPSSQTCGGVAGINGTALTASGASSYVWSPTTGLYTNATATTAYTGTNLATVYAAPTVNTVYTVTGTAAGTGCINTASVSIVYTPAVPIVSPPSATICLNDIQPLTITSSLAPSPFTVTYASGPISVSIPDNSLVGATHSINAPLPATAQITNMRVSFNMTHTWDGDMVIALKAPNNAILNLDYYLSSTGGTGATTGFTNTIISSTGTAALSTGTNPYTGTFKADAVVGNGPFGPSGPTGYNSTTGLWSALYSVPNGNWTLAMYDGGAGDLGTLTSWSLTFDYLFGVPAAGIWTPNGPGSGLYTDPAATTVYTGGLANTVYAKPTPSGVYPYQVTVQSIGPNAFQTFTNPAPITITNGGSTPYPSNITVSGLPTTGASVSSVTLTGLSHTWSDDIDILLQSPTGQNVILMSDVGGASVITNATYTFDDAGPAMGTGANPTGTYHPTNLVGTLGVEPDNWPAPGPGTVAQAAPALALFGNTANVNGVWKLFVVDDFAGDDGTLAGGYSIRFAYPTPGCTSAPRTVVVTVNQPAAITTQPVDQTVCTDKVASFTVVATGTSPTYQWQVSTDGGNTFTNIANGGVYSGVTTATLTISGPPVTMNNNQYRCIVSGAPPCGSVTSFKVILRVNPLPTVVITASPYTRLMPGLTTTLSSTVTPAAASTYTWLRNGAAVPGANSGTLNVNVDGMGDYRLRVTDVNGCTNTSNSITIADSASGKCFIYPNPTNGVFQVRYYSVANNVLPRSITVYNSNGDRVLTQSYSIGRPYDRMDVDMRKYGKGLYWVEIGDLNGNRITMCRVVIQ